MLPRLHLALVILTLVCSLGANGRAQESPATDWAAIRDARADWWSWRPVQDPAPPDAPDADPIDRFVTARLQAAGLRRAPRADRRVLIRRLSFALTGLPPTVVDVEAFVADPAADAYQRLVDRLLDSPRFGERWARHWMDQVRYADSHGSEGDPAIPHAWRYRDYLIRALNDDVGYHQLVREHVAGDLLAEPRVNDELELVESRIGAAQLRFVQHGFAPTDALQEKVRVVDNQIDVVSKAFLGLTVSCARCHDHKFDAISQADYYALFGIFGSTRPAMLEADLPARLTRGDARLAELKSQLRDGLATAWLAGADAALDRAGDDVLQQAAGQPHHPLHAWARLRTAPADQFAARWRELTTEYRSSAVRLATGMGGERSDARDGSLGAPDHWFAHGTGLRDVAERGASRPGALALLPTGERIVDDLLPAGCYSHLRSSGDAAALTSPTFTFDARSVYVRVLGRGDARARYVVQGYPRRGTVYPAHLMRDGEERWVRWNVDYWTGDRGYLEFTTAQDQPVEARDDPQARSWFGVTAVAFAAPDEYTAPRDEIAEVLAPLFEAASASPPQDPNGLRQLYDDVLETCLQAWRRDQLNDAQARFLRAFVRADLLPTHVGDLPALREPLAAWRQIESALPRARRVPGVRDAEARDWPLYQRGDHRQPGPAVPRRFLESIDATPYAADAPARLQLADDLIAPDNPFTARVAVNRVWAQLFGRGLCATVDNVGRLGEQPTHPLLLDWLASRFVEDGWSMKTLIRRIVLSDTWCASSQAPDGAGDIDPDNRLLSHARIRRLDAEALRDALLAVSTQLQPGHTGPPVDGDTPRRSVYVRVQRNQLEPFLHTFDAPAPHTTRGMRTATNVPAQALTLLNDPFVHRAAAALADAVLASAASTPDARLRELYDRVLGRAPDDAELERCLTFLTEAEQAGRALERHSSELAATRTATTDALQRLRADAAARVLASRANGTVTQPPAPAPLAAWTFESDARDVVGELHGQLRGSARIEAGALVLDGAGYIETGPLGRDLAAKTLEAWVQLADLDQRAGGVMTIQTRDGSRFDAIVFAEQQPGEWLPGSNNFRRTQPVGGPPETEAQQRPVHVALRYGADGTITAFRDGRRYGDSYHTDDLLRFNAGESVVLFGLRHSPAGGNRHLRGRVLEARLYDRALSDDEIRRSAGGTDFVTAEQRRLAMSAAERAAEDRLQAELRRLDEARRDLDIDAGQVFQPDAPWVELAHAILNLQEFVYLR